MLALPAVLAALALVPGLGASAVVPRDSSLPAGITCANGASPQVIVQYYETSGDGVRVRLRPFPQPPARSPALFISLSDTSAWL
jgi:hypothetical protein